MNDFNRSQALKNNLSLLYDKLGCFEEELIVTSSAENKFNIKQRISREILPEIRKYESEYWELCPLEIINISEDEAKIKLFEVEQAVNSIQQISSDTYPPALIPILQEIKAKLEDKDSQKSASAKFKVVLPLIPTIASYEVEMKTEGLMRNVWEKIRKLLRR